MSSGNSNKQSWIVSLTVSLRKSIRGTARLIYKAIKKPSHFIRWALPSLNDCYQNLIGLKNPQRILVIYDTTAQPFSVGDLLIFQEASLVLCQKHNVDIVDFVIVFDSENPASSDRVFAGAINEDNVIYHIASLLPLAQVNQKLGSFFVFNSHAQLQQYINENKDRYYVWPSGWKMATREYLSPPIFNDLLYWHYKEHGSIPKLTCRPFLQTWAENFYFVHVSPQLSVTINIRNNKGWHLERNSNIDSWIELIRYCESRYPVKFVIICSRIEVDDRFRSCPNVVIAKDHYTSVEQDMALIHSSAFHMGAGSGPATMAWFNTKPYLMVNTVYKTGEFFEREGMVEYVENGIQRFWFAGPNQKVANGNETAELLIREFEKLWATIDLKESKELHEMKNSNAPDVSNWLR